MPVRPATAADIDALTDMRLRLEREVDDPQAAEDTALADAVRAYFESEIAGAFAGRDGFTGTLTFVEDVDGRIVATGSIAFYRRPPYTGNLSGGEAFISNVYTIPGRRGAGHGRALVERLLAEAQARGAPRVLLNTSASGEPLCRAYGFERKENAMELWLGGRLS